MNAIVISAVLGAAVLHASWNAMLKSGADRFFWMTVQCLVQGCIAIVAILVLGLPPAASWPYVAASAAVHVIYQLLLVRTYAVGDFGQTYPIARGFSPLLVTLGAFAFASEDLNPHKLVGIALVSGGIIALAFEGRRIHFDRVPAALATGVFIGAYTVIDGMGARVAGNALSFMAATNVPWALAIGAIYIGKRGLALPPMPRRDAVASILGGIIGCIGYAIVIWAMTLAPMGLVSALRETSVVFAALIARAFLNERLTLGRLSACAVIAGGGALLSA